MDFKSFIILDCETTGLPAFEKNTKITELALISVQTNHILLGVYPRVQNKLTLCFNPWKIIKPDVERITGLSNTLLEHESAFNENTIDTLLNFIARLARPVCFVAHNGYCFDFPLLKKHITSLNKHLPDYVFCVDSLVAFRNISANLEVKEENEKIIADETSLSDDDLNEILLNETIAIENLHCSTEKCEIPIDIQKINETTPSKKTDNAKIIRKSRKQVTNKEEVLKTTTAKKRLVFDKTKRQVKRSFKLGDVYERLLGKEPLNAHQAETDVIMLLECIVHLGESFVVWANQNAKSFNEMKSDTNNPIRN